MTAVFRRVFVDVFENLSAQRLRHLLHSIIRKVTMSVNIESFAFDTSESFWHLDVQTELEANLGLASAGQSTYFNDLS